MRITNLGELLEHPRWGYPVGFFALGAGINAYVHDAKMVGVTAILLGSAHLYRALRNDINKFRSRQLENNAYQNELG